MAWLESIGKFFEGLTSPIDYLMGFLVQFSIDGLSWILGAIVGITKLNDNFEDIQSIQDILVLIQFFVGLMVVAIGTYHVFSQLLSIAAGREFKTPREIFGDFLLYGWRLLSMPYFLFFSLKLNAIWVDMLTKRGLSADKLIESLSLGGKSTDEFMKSITKMFVLQNLSGIISVLIAVVLLIVFIILWFQFIKRSGEIIYMYLFIPFVALSTLSTDLDMYSTWWRQALSVIFSQGMQVTGLYLSVQLILEGHGQLGLGLLLATISTPVIIKEFAYNSGVGGSLKSLAFMGLSAR
ncbi:hypothetical protein HCJ46_17100 [Listeria booriae]|uniref:conjugal transfer protein TrbL family protein n=1 Tax=Listeria booriae TaxID=1552123 RepID=UPI0016289515|nr:conjugal transfer protein TrbL family protein [Listeria booriae]MBC1920471.1 hypothetical protein [Listeria booriae]